MARAKKQQSPPTIEQVLWNCRVALPSVGSTEKNRDAVVGLAFLKFAGDKFNKQRAAISEQYGGIPEFLEDPSFCNSNNVFYLDETARWDDLVRNAGANDIAVKLDLTMVDTEEKNPPLKGALPQNLYATLGASITNRKTLIDEVGKLDGEYFQVEDLISRVYEYFLRTYTTVGIKEDGEFYTPANIVKLIAEMIEPYSVIVHEYLIPKVTGYYIGKRFPLRHKVYLLWKVNSQQAEFNNCGLFYKIRKNNNNFIIKHCKLQSNNVKTKKEYYNPIQRSFTGPWDERFGIKYMNTTLNMIKSILEYYFLQHWAYKRMEYRAIVLENSKTSNMYIKQVGDINPDMTEYQLASSLAAYSNKPNGICDGLNYVEDCNDVNVYQRVLPLIFEALCQSDRYKMMTGNG